MPVKKVPVYINKKKYLALPGESMLSVAQRNKIDIPHLCWHEDLPVFGGCRICLVEDSDGKVLTSCTLRATKDLAITTDTKDVQQLRQQNLQLLLANHQANCWRCQQKFDCPTNKLIEKYQLDFSAIIKTKIKEKIQKLNVAAEINPAACIACNQCASICDQIGIGYLQLVDQGTLTTVETSKDAKVDCIYCGQCTAHCPVSAVHEQNQLADVIDSIEDNKKIVIAQMAPSVRCSIGEEFGLAPGTDLTGQCYTALRQLGFDYVFDVNMGADITTLVEAAELLKRLKENKNLPMFTACCPAWVKYVEFYHPELINNLTSARSPHIHSGGAYKTWWAREEGVKPKNIVVVSIMPCTSKKYEARHTKLKINGLWPVDHVITTREFAVWLKQRRIDLDQLPVSDVDLPGQYSGAGAIYGASGGVMESALRTAYEQYTGKALKKLEFKQVRGRQGIKKAEIDFGDRQLKVAVAATVRNAALLIAELKNDPQAYQYIEVMACPGGCIGGGGQPIPHTKKIVSQRTAGLYRHDSKMKVRKAHDNPVVQDFMNNYIAKLTRQEQERILFTTYTVKKKFD